MPKENQSTTPVGDKQKKVPMPALSEIIARIDALQKEKEKAHTALAAETMYNKRSVGNAYANSNKALEKLGVTFKELDVKMKAQEALRDAVEFAKEILTFLPLAESLTLNKDAQTLPKDAREDLRKYLFEIRIRIEAMYLCINRGRNKLTGEYLDPAFQRIEQDTERTARYVANEITKFGINMENLKEAA